MPVRIIIIAIGMALPLCSRAQFDLGLHFMRTVWQSSLTNPALMPDQPFLIGLPAAGYQLHQPDLILEKYIAEDPNGGYFLDVENILADMPEKATFQNVLHLETLRLGWNKGAWKVGAHHAIVNRSSLTYPKDLLGLLWQGNAAYIGDTLHIGPELDITSFHEIGVQGAWSSRRISLGAGVRSLQGIHHIRSRQTGFSLFTDDDIYQLYVATDYSVQTSGILTYSGFSDSTFIPAVSAVPGLGFSGNQGFAIDLGIRYSPIEKLDIAASIIGLGGRILWKQNAREYHSQGAFYYEGEDIESLLASNSISFDNKLDTIKEIFDFEEKTISYTSRLPVNVYISALYRLSEKWEGGVLAHMEAYDGQYQPSFVLSGKYHPVSWLHLGVTTSHQRDRWNILGINFALKTGIFQLYGVSDNILTVFSPAGHSFASGRVGFNLVFSARNRE